MLIECHRHKNGRVIVTPFKKQDLSKLKVVVAEMGDETLQSMYIDFPEFRRLWGVVKEVLKNG